MKISRLSLMLYAIIMIKNTNYKKIDHLETNKL